MIRGLLVLLAVAALTACSSGVEQTVLGQFFAASRLRDRTMLGNVATVAFEPATQGIVTTFTITRIGREEPRDGGVVSKEVTINAPVRLPSGQTVAKTLVVTLQRAGKPPELPATSPWIVTDVMDASSPGATPRSR